MEGGGAKPLSEENESFGNGKNTTSILYQYMKETYISIMSLVNGSWDLKCRKGWQLFFLPPIF